MRHTEFPDIPQTETAAPADIDLNRWNYLHNALQKDTRFDDINVEDEISERRAAFEALDPADRAMLENAALQFARSNDGALLPTLKMLGKETDETYAEALVAEHGNEVENLAIATTLFRMTYRLWKTNHLVAAAETGTHIDPEPREVIESKLREINRCARKLSHYTVEATHATDPALTWQITADRSLLQSKSNRRDHQYEGTGVYSGILGGFGSWAEDVFTYRVALADTFPIISSYADPKAMANILCEMIDFNPDASDDAIPHGLIEWRQQDFCSEAVPVWKLRLMRQLLHCDIQVERDENDHPCLIMDTDADPIVWATLCRALRIYRAMPADQRRFSDLPPLPEQEEIPPTGDGNTRYRGVKRRQVEKNWQ